MRAYTAGRTARVPQFDLKRIATTVDPTSCMQHNPK